MDFRELLNSEQYDFIRTSERLGSRIMLLGLGGSYAPKISFFVLHEIRLIYY